jgi:RNA polymerase sigma-70 factor (ECF subfamily)
MDSETNRWVGALYLEYQSRILAWFSRKLNSREEAEDLVQEVFAAAANSAKTYDREQSSEVVWLFSIAHNLLNRHLRDLYRHREIEEKLAPPEFEERELERVIASDILYKALKLLSQNKRNIILLSFYKGHNPEEIAE